MDANENMQRVSALVGILAAHSPLSATAQAAVRIQVDAGHLDDITHALAHALLQRGIHAGEIPANSGDITKIDTIQTACVSAVRRYTEGGGLLTAGGAVPQWRLAAKMVTLWRNEFSAPIPVTRKLSQGLSEEEILSRLSVSVLYCQQEITRRVKLFDGVALTKDGEAEGYFVRKEEMEILLGVLAAKALEAFDDPNTVNHKLIHEKDV